MVKIIICGKCGKLECECPPPSTLARPTESTTRPTEAHEVMQLLRFILRQNFNGRKL